MLHVLYLQYYLVIIDILLVLNTTLSFFYVRGDKLYLEMCLTWLNKITLLADSPSLWQYICVYLQIYT